MDCANRSKARLRRSMVLVCLGLAALAGNTQAQVQRSFVNLGFEDPALNSGNTIACYQQLRGQNDTTNTPQVPGWRTTHPTNVSPPDTTSPDCTVTNTQPGRLIEIWRNGVLGVPARSGNQHAELNAQAVSNIYQRICLVQGETVDWRFSHRGRESSTTGDVADFIIGSADDSANTLTGTQIVRATDSSDGSPGAASQCITGGTCTRTAASAGWGDYQGSFIVTAAFAGVRDFGFTAVSSVGGTTFGNFIDDINVTLRPFVEFSSATYSVGEAGGIANVQMRVVGVVPAGGISVPVTVTGTATAGSDFVSFTSLPIPAGDYGAGTAVTTPLTITNDAVIEDNETIIVAIVPSLPTSPYVLTSTLACGAVAVGTTTVTIIDNDVDLRTTKTASTATPAVGGPFTYTVTFQNNTARPTVAPVTAHDATAAVADALPAGLAFTGWTCAASNGATCPAASGSGAISGNAVLPAGTSTAGGAVTYTITATANGAPNCGPITNTSSITLPAGLQEATAVQAGFTSPTPGGTANDTASAIVDPVCPTSLVLNKTTLVHGGEGFNFLLTNTTQTTGTATTTAANTAVQVDGNPAVGVQPFAVATIGQPITIQEQALSGWALNSATCSVAGTTVGSRSGATYTIPAAEVLEDRTLTCTFTNDPVRADLSVTKTNNATTVVKGQSTTYAVVVRNGPGTYSADGAVVKDEPQQGLANCTATCSVTSGAATCPATPSALLTASGVQIPSFPPASSLTFMVTCNVP